MSFNASYQILAIPLDGVVSKRVLDGTQGKRVYGVYLVPTNFVDTPLPVGAQFSLHVGDNEPILFASDFKGLSFDCGHDGGFYFSNAVAQVGKFVSLMLVFSEAGPVFAQ